MNFAFNQSLEEVLLLILLSGSFFYILARHTGLPFGSPSAELESSTHAGDAMQQLYITAYLLYDERNFGACSAVSRLLAADLSSLIRALDSANLAGRAEIEMGNLQQAETDFLQGLQILEGSSELNSFEVKRQQLFLLGSLANVYILTKNDEMAWTTLSEVREIAESEPGFHADADFRKHVLAQVYYDLGVYHERCQDWSEAAENYEKGAEYYSEFPELRERFLSCRTAYLDCASKAFANLLGEGGESSI